MITFYGSTALHGVLLYVPYRLPLSFNQTLTSFPISYLITKQTISSQVSANKSKLHQRENKHSTHSWSKPIATIHRKNLAGIQTANTYYAWSILENSKGNPKSEAREKLTCFILLTQKHLHLELVHLRNVGTEIARSSEFLSTLVV